jgi:hypothetical protein
MWPDVLSDLFPIALGLALFPPILLAAALLLTSPQGRRKDLALMLGLVTGAFAAVAILAVLGTWIGHPASERNRAIGTGLVALFFGLGFLAQALSYVRRLTTGRERFADVQKLTGLTARLAHLDAGRAFLMGIKLATFNPRAPMVLVPAAALIVAQDAGLGRSLAAALAFAGMVTLGAGTMLVAASLPGHHVEAGLGRFSHWLEAHGGAVLLPIFACWSVIGLSRSLRLLL